MYRVKDGCPGCGACLGVCPVNAIAPGNLAVTITSECVDCGVCVSKCPIGLIEKAVECKPATSGESGRKLTPGNSKEGGLGDA